LIILDDIAKEYIQGKTKVKVLNKLCLHVNYNENIGIIGPSGSGKSTLLNLIGLLEQPTTGNIKIGKVDFNNMKDEEKVVFRKENIGFIFQNNQLLEDFNVEENVALPLLMNGNSFRKSISKANDYLHLLGISDRNKFKPGLLSGGEQQRVAIARALIKNPKILLADEPTGSLDHENTKIVFNSIKKLSKENKIITVFATHNLNLVKLLDKCLLMEGGKLIDYKS
jgi:ABC-type lipoprotein export system ATPase subunit